MRTHSVASSPIQRVAFAPPAYAADAERTRWGWAEAFIAFQLLWGITLFIPGAQAYRTMIRALPYLVSAAALVYYFRRPTGEPLMPSTKWLLASFALLAVNLLHETTHMIAGVGQIVFQISIAAPAFWMARAVPSEKRFFRVLWVFFFASFLGAAVGILQVYYPNTFLPPEFSALARTNNPDIIASLTYIGTDGRPIIRPSGLSDMPGGAAVAGMTTMIVGLMLAVRRNQSWLPQVVYITAAAIGMTTLYLTQVRSLAIVAAASVVAFALLRLRQGRIVDGVVTLGAGAALVVGAYVWAVAVGGEALSERFFGLIDEGVFRTFQEQRGQFLKYTLSELVYEFPFGAGMGRWGMMQTLFGDPTMWLAPAVHVEIQPTGWLLDGGVPMWFLYGGALVTALRYSYRLAIHAANDVLQDAAVVMLCIQIAGVGLCLSGPVFNTQLGIQFWALTGALYGAAVASRAPHAQAADRHA